MTAVEVMGVTQNNYSSNEKKGRSRYATVRATLFLLSTVTSNFLVHKQNVQDKTLQQDAYCTTQFE
jgi:hypothetical protein